MLAFPKSQPRKRVKARRDRLHAKKRRACVDFVWKREQSVCQHCKRYLKRITETANFRDVGHVDEILPKSLGGDDTDPANCRLVCHAFHFSGSSGAHRTTDRDLTAPEMQDAKSLHYVQDGEPR